MGALALRQFAGHSPQTQFRVLVLDDDAFDRKRVRRWVERNFHASVDLVEAPDLNHFSEQIARTAFDLVLLDYALADGDGLDAIRMLRDHKENANCYAVMISGRDDDGLRSRCLSEGCDQFVSKSVLDGAKIQEILLTVQTRALKPAFSERASEESALAYWSARAERRSQRAQTIERADNLSVLSDLLGIELHASPEQEIEADIEARAFSEPMSAALRFFISDFLACDEFEFLPSSVDNATSEQDFDR